MKPLLNNNKEKIPYHSRQYIDLPEIFVQNASLEIAWTKILNKKNPSIAGNKIIPFITKGKEGFDIPYLYHRTQRVLGQQIANCLSPIGTVHYDENKKQYRNLSCCP